MKININIECESKEIAAFVLALQERQSSAEINVICEKVTQRIADDLASEASCAHIP